LLVILGINYINFNKVRKINLRLFNICGFTEKIAFDGDMRISEKITKKNTRVKILIFNGIFP
jgi:hypothetical protein